ncbi:MAG: hypothetical protein WC648_04085 [Candidatus Paceibacterota bacterium]|jgi:hypothetical protein
MTQIYDDIIEYSSEDYSYNGELMTSEGQKALAGNHSVGYKYEFLNESNNSSFTINYFENDEGIGLTRSPSMASDVRTNEQVKEGQHGSIGFRSFYGARALNFDCRIVADSAKKADELLTSIKQTLSLPGQPTDTNMGDIRIRWTDVQGKKWQIYARIVSDPDSTSEMNFPLVHDMQLQLKAFDPVIYSQEENTIEGYQGWIQGGFYLNTELPFSIPYIYNYATTVTNNGTFEAPTRIKLYGYARKPAIYNISTGARLVIDYELEENDFLEIDSIKGTITNSAGDDIASLTTSDDVFIFLKVGENKIIYYDGEQANNPVLTGNSNRLETVVRNTDIVSLTNRNRMIVESFETKDGDGEWVSDTNDIFESSSLKTSINFTNADNNYVLIYNSTRTQQNWANIYNTGKIRLKIYIDSVEDISSVDFRYGSSSTDYYHINVTEQYNGDAFADGDNILEFDLSTASSTGTPDSTAIDFIAIKVNSTTNFGKQSVSTKGGIKFCIDNAPLDTALTADGWIGGSDMYGWYFDESTDQGTAEFSTTKIRTGAASLKLATTGTASSTMYTLPADGYGNPYSSSKKYLIPVKPSTTYRVTCYMQSACPGGTIACQLLIIKYNSSFARTTTTISTQSTEKTDWFKMTNTFTTSATEIWMIPRMSLTTSGAVGEVYYDVNSMTIEEVKADTSYGGNEIRELKLRLTSASVNDMVAEERDSGGAYANTYTTPTSVSEAATAKCAINPTMIHISQIGVWVVSKGSGNLTLILHDSANAVRGDFLIANASVTNGAFNYFQVAALYDGTAGWHFHVTSTVADATIKTNTTNDLATASFVRLISCNTHSHKVELNGNTINIEYPFNGLSSSSYIDFSRNIFYLADVYSSSPKTRIGNLASATAPMVLTLTDGRYTVNSAKEIVFKINTGYPITNVNINVDTYGISATETQYMYLSRDGVTYYEVSSVADSSLDQNYEGHYVDGLENFWIKFASTGSTTYVHNIYVTANIDTTSYKPCYLSSGTNTLYLSSNSTICSGTIQPSYQATFDYMYDNYIELDSLLYYQDKWTTSGTYNETQYMVEDSALTLTSSGTESIATLSGSYNFNDYDDNDVLISNQYIDDQNSLLSYYIRFYKDENYAQADLTVPTTSGWFTNKVRLQDLVLTGLTTFSGTYDTLKLYTTSTVSGTVNVTWGGIFVEETDTIETLPLDKIVINWRDAKI